MEVDGRHAVDGTVLTPLDLDAARTDFETACETPPPALPTVACEINGILTPVRTLFRVLSCPFLSTHRYAAGIRSVAITLMHAYRYSEFEKELGTLAHAIGFEQVSLSHETSPLMKIVARGDTTTVDACVRLQ